MTSQSEGCRLSGVSPDEAVTIRPGRARLDTAEYGDAWQARQGWARSGQASWGVVRHGRHDISRHGRTQPVSERQAWLGKFRLGAAWHVLARRGSHGSALQVVAGHGTAGVDIAGLNSSLFGRVRCDAAGAERQRWAWRGLLGQARHGGERQSKTGHGITIDSFRTPVWMKKPRCVRTGASDQREQTPMTNVQVTEAAAIQIDRIAAETISVPIVGTAPLIVHNFSEKSKRQMLEAQQGKKKLKEVREPVKEYEAAFYRITSDAIDADYGFPVTAFKAATTGAARFYDKSVSMTALRQFLFMRGILTDGDPQQLVPIHGTPRMREDVVRLGGPSRSADLRYRPEFPTWSATLEVTYVTSSISRQSVLSLIDAGGLGIGVGEWRPEKRGEFGTYAVDQSKAIEVLS